MFIDPRQLSLNLEPLQRIRRELPTIVRRVAIRGGISQLHALAFIEANGLGPAGGR